MKDDDAIPSCGEYRGVPLHADQSEDRLVVVRAAIDTVQATDDLHRLYGICCGAAVAPEARIFAGGKILAATSQANREHRILPRGRGVDVSVVRSHVEALSSNRARCPTHYGSLLEVQDGLVRRERPLDC